jgi:hypothetical protein
VQLDGAPVIERLPLSLVDHSVEVLLVATRSLCFSERQVWFVPSVANVGATYVLGGLYND